MQNFITIGTVVYERIEDKQTNKQTNILVFFIYIEDYLQFIQNPFEINLTIVRLKSGMNIIVWFLHKQSPQLIQTVMRFSHNYRLLSQPSERFCGVVLTIYACNNHTIINSHAGFQLHYSQIYLKLVSGAACTGFPPFRK
jgi:hypothetical protein